jgi:hypothetical protein
VLSDLEESAMTAATPPQPTSPATAVEPPPAVIQARRLLFAMAVLQLVMGGLASSNALTIPDEIRLGATGFGSATEAIAAEAVLDSILAGLMVLGAVYVSRGRRWARVVAYIAGAIQLIGGLALAAQDYFLVLVDDVAPSAFRDWQATTPVVTAAGRVGAILMVIAPVALVALLSSRAANAFLRGRKGAEAVTDWTPPSFRAG